MTMSPLETKLQWAKVIMGATFGVAIVVLLADIASSC